MDVCKRCGQQLGKTSGYKCLARPDLSCLGWTGEHPTKKVHMKTLYFAYGSNLEEAKMVDMAPSSRFYAWGALQGYRLRFTNADPEKKGLCSIEASSFKDYVQGVVYELNHWELPETYSNSTKSVLDVLLHDGRYVRAFVFYAKDNHLVTPDEDYLMRIHKKYQDYGFLMKPLEDALDQSTY
jgi:hypothetical protein